MVLVLVVVWRVRCDAPSLVDGALEDRERVDGGVVLSPCGWMGVWKMRTLEERRMKPSLMQASSQKQSSAQDGYGSCFFGGQFQVRLYTMVVVRSSPPW